MKKILASILVIMLMLTSFSATLAENTGAQATETEPQATETQAAEETAAAEPAAAAVQYSYDRLTVAVTTPLTGNFFTPLWGNASSDLDVRSLIHGYNLTEWNTDEDMFAPDQSVISGMTATQETNGDLTFIIALYSDLTYSDGTPITAWDYAFSLLLTMAPEMEELGANVLRPTYLKGYKEYISGEAKALSGVKVTGDYLLTMTIDADYLPFFYELGLLDCTPYPISVIAPGVKVADDGEGVYLANADAAVEAPVFTAELLRKTILDENTGYRTHPKVTSGPYTLVSYENGTAMFEINPMYKGDSKGRKPMIPAITVTTMSEAEMAEALQSGSVTLLNKISDAAMIGEIGRMTAENELLAADNYARSGLSFISFNTDRAPLDDPAVRQAIAYLLDRDAMISEAVGNYGLRSTGYFGIGQWMYQVLNGTMGYPVEEAAENATAQEKKAYEDAMKAWEALSLDAIEGYVKDEEKGLKLLEQAGWTLNESGAAFNPETDTLRYKQTEAGLKPLKLTLAYAEGSAAAKAMENVLPASLAAYGIEVAVSALPGDTLLNQYYRLAEPEYDMFFLATNFDAMYDPSISFVEDGEGQHVWRSSALADEALWEAAVAMRKTEPGDLLTYCERWLAFQKRFAEILPALPLYSNVYFDSYPRVLHEYAIASQISWPQAIRGSYLADYIPEESEEGAEELLEGIGE